MAKAPQTIGDPIYASQDGVYVYKDADIESDKLGNFLTGGDEQYSKFDLIGSYNGVKEGSFYQVTASVYVRVVPLLPKVKKTVTGWVLGNQITTDSKEDLSTAQAQQKKEDLQAYLDDITGETDTKKGLTGNTPPETSPTSTTNIVLGFAILTTIVIIIVGLIKKSSKAKK